MRKELLLLRKRAGLADDCAGATARWAKRTILRSLDDANVAQVIAKLELALSREDVAA